MRKKTALIIVGMQNDYLPGGAVPVPEADLLIPVINSLFSHFDVVTAIQDWHPKDHCAFITAHPDKKLGDQVIIEGLPLRLSEPHCVANTYGARIAAGLNQTTITRVFRTGLDRRVPSDNAFFDADRLHVSGLDDFLKGHGVRSVAVVGVPTDYTVKRTVLTALDLGYTAAIICDACRALDLLPADVETALSIMERRGALLKWATAYGIEPTWVRETASGGTRRAPGLGTGFSD